MYTILTIIIAALGGLTFRRKLMEQFAVPARIVLALALIFVAGNVFAHEQFKYFTLTILAAAAAFFAAWLIPVGRRQLVLLPLTLLAAHAQAFGFRPRTAGEDIFDATAYIGSAILVSAAAYCFGWHFKARRTGIPSSLFKQIALFVFGIGLMSAEIIHLQNERVSAAIGSGYCLITGALAIIFTAVGANSMFKIPPRWIRWTLLLFLAFPSAANAQIPDSVDAAQNVLIQCDEQCITATYQNQWIEISWATNTATHYTGRPSGRADIETFNLRAVRFAQIGEVWIVSGIENQSDRRYIIDSATGITAMQVASATGDILSYRYRPLTCVTTRQRVECEGR